MNLPEKIMTLRRRNGWSQEELAERLDVSRQSVSKWEMGQSVPELDKVIQMSDLFGVSADSLIRDELELDFGEQARTGEKDAAEPTETGRTLSVPEMTVLLRNARRKNLLIATGVALCVLSPILFILEKFLAAAFIAPVMIAAAVACFILAANLWKNTPFAVYQKGDRLSADAAAWFRERFPAANLRFLLFSLVGVVLFILSPIPLIALAIAKDEKLTDLQAETCVAILLAVVAVGVFLVLLRGEEMAVWERFRAIQSGVLPEDLREGEEPQEALAREAEERRNPIGKFYWSIITAAYLLVSFLTHRWEYTWIIWPVAAVLDGAIEAVFYFVRRNK